MRAFIAIELPVRIKDALSGIQGRLKTEKFQTGWVKPQNLHLTLKFLGDISPEQLGQIKEIITAITKISPGFKINLRKLGVFPNLQAARIIWVGANQLPLELKQLIEQLETGITKSGIPLENRDFSAHITIGRIKKPPAPDDLQKALDKTEIAASNFNWEFDCEKITLFESRLGPGGPTYTALEKFSLKIN